MDGGRGDTANEVDNIFKRFQHASQLSRREEKESLRLWSQRPLQVAEQPCFVMVSDSAYGKNLWPTSTKCTGGCSDTGMRICSWSPCVRIWSWAPKYLGFDWS